MIFLIIFWKKKIILQISLDLILKKKIHNLSHKIYIKKFIQEFLGRKIHWKKILRKKFLGKKILRKKVSLEGDSLKCDSSEKDYL
jgi:hypothetical protein